MPNHTDIEAFCETVFGGAPEDGSLVVCVRTIGEKGTPSEGRANNYFTTYNGVEKTADFLEEIAETAEEARAGVFVVPGLLKSDVLETRKATTEMIDGFMSVCLDFDGGDISAKIEAAEKDFGPATLRVSSGGLTEDGQVKTHLYWKTLDYTKNVEAVGQTREHMAKRYAGDSAFKRPAQVIRVPGTTHLKNNKESKCLIRSSNREARFPSHGWHTGSVAGTLLDVAQYGGMDVSIPDLVVKDIHEGGEETNRWSVFSQVAGHYVHQARLGNITIQEARNYTKGWMMAHMHPPWPDDRFDSEFSGVLRADVKNNGGMPVQQTLEEHVERNALDAKELGRWRIGQYTTQAPKPRQWLVRNLVLAGKKQMLVAAGGAGKSYAALQLGLTIAATANPDFISPLTWMNHDVDADGAGVVIMIACEDDQDEITRRLHELDPGGDIRRAAADNFIVIPTDDVGGAFPLVSYDRKGLPVYSAPWQQFLDAVRAVDAAGRKVSLVIIDTLNATLHGDENSAQIASEYVSAVSPITGKLGAALLVTHHIRKSGGEDTKPMTADTVRGSNALINSMRNVIGIYQSPKWEEYLPMIGRAPIENELFEMKVLKGNVSELTRDTEYLVRHEGAYLTCVTKAINAAITEAKRSEKDYEEERKAWAKFVIGYAAEQGKPFKIRGDAGVGERIATFPLIVTGEKRSPSVLMKFIRDLKATGELEEHSVYDDSTGKIEKNLLDVKGGALSMGRSINTSGSFVPPKFEELKYDRELKKIIAIKNTRTQ